MSWLEMLEGGAVFHQADALEVGHGLEQPMPRPYPWGDVAEARWS